MKSCIDNFINGNLEDARKQAKRYKLLSLAICLRDEYGYKAYKALTIARYLKGQATFQQACDAK